jgi:ribonuclease Z
MKILFIGSGSAKTVLNRHHSSVVISAENHNLLVDAGDGVSRALLDSSIDYNSLDSILISHFHPDHFSGLPHLIVEMKMSKRTKPLNIFLHESLKETARQILKSLYVFEDWLDFKLNYMPFSYGEKMEVSKNLFFTAKGNAHLEKYGQYDKEDKVSFASSSFLFEAEKKKFFFSGDVGKADDLKLFADVETDYFITEISHVQKEEFITILKGLKTGKAVLTHLPEEDIGDIKSWLNNLPLELKNKIELAYEGLLLK